MKRNITFITTITLLLLILLSSCAGNVESEKAPAPPPDSYTQVVATKSEDAEPTLDFSYDEDSCKPWQRVYLALLREICSRETPIRTAQSEGRFHEYDAGQLSDGYWLYDVDKDGIPEIFIRFGICEANYRTEVYTCRNGEAVFVGDFPSGHSSLYTWPKENAVLFYSGQMRYGYTHKISIVNGTLVHKESFREDINGNPDADHTAVDKIVPGSVYLTEFRTTLNLPKYTPLTLPIYEYYHTVSLKSDTTADVNTNKAVKEVLAGNRKLYGVSGDGFGGDTGWMSFKDYCQPGAVDKYAKQPLHIRKSGWVDFNWDGREECILLLEETGQNPCSTDIYVVLSEQDGVVYAYCINYHCDHEVFQDGVFAETDDWSFRISFYRNQCYLKYSKSHDIKSPAISWETDTK